jgi:hypothetical protein
VWPGLTQQVSLGTDCGHVLGVQGKAKARLIAELITSGRHAGRCLFWQFEQQSEQQSLIHSCAAGQKEHCHYSLQRMRLRSQFAVHADQGGWCCLTPGQHSHRKLKPDNLLMTNTNRFKLSKMVPLC